MLATVVTAKHKSYDEQMTKKTVTYKEWLQQGLLRVSRIHFGLVLAYGIQIVVYDAWHVLAPEVVMWRWLALSALMTAVAGVWYLSHNKQNDIPSLKRLLALLLLADVFFASFNVYTQRGMASRAVLLFLVPVIASTILLSRAALFATATLSSAIYVTTAIVYFTMNFNEGYKTELYSEVLFYSFVFFLSAAILSVVVRFGGATNDS